MPDRPSGTALVIGKFMPFHRGHEALIQWTLTWAEKVVVLVGALEGEPIPGPLRWEWVSRHFRQNPRVRVEYTDRDLPTAPEPDAEVSRVWGHYLKGRFPEVDWISASEGWAPLVAGTMGIRWRIFDQARRSVPISATALRRDPWSGWDHLPEVVRPHFRKKICLVGPESTGKTTLAQALAEYFTTVWVPEQAREIIDQAGGFSPGLLGRIVWEQEEAVRQAEPLARRWLFVDSDFVTTQFYARKLSGEDWIPPWTPRLAETHRYDLYLWCEPDIPYEKDAQRAETDQRQEDARVMRILYERTGIPLVSVQGLGSQRLECALDILKKKFCTMDAANV